MVMNYNELIKEFEECIAYQVAAKMEDNEYRTDVDEIINEVIEDTLYDLDGDVSHKRILKIVKQEME